MYLGIDPGRFKIGFAAVDGDRLVFSAIIPKDREEVLPRAMNSLDLSPLKEWTREGSVDSVALNRDVKIFIGDGTSSDELKENLAGAADITTVNEYGTTLAGRELYWKLHPPKGLWALIPTSLRTPPRDVDDLAAWAIIISALKNNADKK